MSDLSQVLRSADIFTWMDAISGLKSIPWAGFGKLVNTPLDSSIFGIWYHNLQYCFSDSIYIAELTRLAQVVISYYGITKKSGAWYL
jgi:hypothetical protein